jgi:hypothetical protein
MALGRNSVVIFINLGVRLRLLRLYGDEEWLVSDIYQLGSKVEIASSVGAFKLSLIGAYGIAIGG